MPDSLLRVGPRTAVMDEFEIIDNLTAGNISKMSLQNGIDALDVLSSKIEQNQEFDEMKNIIWSRNTFYILYSIQYII